MNRSTCTTLQLEAYTLTAPFAIAIVALTLMFATAFTTHSEEAVFGSAIPFGASDSDYANDITLDGAGNIYITGGFSGTIDFDPGSEVTFLAAVGITDIFVVKLDSEGQLQWARSMGGLSGGGFGQTITVDDQNNVYTAGSFGGNIDFDPSAGIFTLRAASAAIPSSRFLQKLDSSGDLEWATTISGPTGYQGLATDSSGNVYTMGSFTDATDFDPSIREAILVSAGQNDVFIRKLDSEGNFLWARSFGGTGEDLGRAMTIHTTSADPPVTSLYTTGSFSGSADFDPGIGEAILDTVGVSDHTDIFVQKLDTSGNLVWAKAMGGDSQDGVNNIGYGIALDPAGNIFTTGAFVNTVDFDPGAASTTLTTIQGGTFPDVFVCKFDPAGEFAWAKSVGGITGTSEGHAIVTDSAGNLYTRGFFTGTIDFNSGAGSASLSTNGNTDMFALKLNTLGNFVWAKSVGTLNFLEEQSLAVDASGSLYTAGAFENTTDFDPDDRTFNVESNGDLDIFILKFLKDTDEDGMPDLWETQFGFNPLVDETTLEPDPDFDPLFDPDPFDPDDDGLTNLQEFWYHGDPFNDDTDHDGLRDGDEVIAGTEVDNLDTDQDGMADGWEVDNDLNPLLDDSNEDPDGDGLTNLQEYLNRTDPHNNDSDGDGVTDETELDTGTNPEQPNDFTGQPGGGGGTCFIATAAYGTPIAEQIYTLRNIRDTRLLKSSLGSAFVDSYYRISPPIADAVATNQTLRTIVRAVLTPIIFASDFVMITPTLARCLLLLSILITVKHFTTPRKSLTEQ